MIIATDLEGVLIPELWVEIAEFYGIEELKKTTRDISDFEELMNYRIRILRREGLKLSDLQKVTRQVMAYPGSMEFLSWCRRQGQVIIISDTFHELSDPLVWDMGGFNLFANRFTVDGQGKINGFKLRIRGMKWNILEKLGEIGFYIVALGDSYNDLSMLRKADKGLLYNPPAALKEEYSQFPTLDSYEKIRETVLNLPNLDEISP